MHRYLAVIVLSALIVSVPCDPLATEVFHLKWATAEQIVAEFGGGRTLSEKELTDDRQAWVDRFANNLARRLPRDPAHIRPRWHYTSPPLNVFGQLAFDQRSAGGRSGGRIALPTGIVRPPIALPNQNAVLVTGTPAGIDRFRELLAMFDRKPRMVNIELRLVDAPRSDKSALNMDANAEGDGLQVTVRRPGPPGGLTARYSPNNSNNNNATAELRTDRRRSSANNLTAAQITATNNQPAAIRCGRTIPFVTSEVSYDRYGRRHVDRRVNGVFTGIELLVKPQINNDDTLTMLLRPTFIEAVGTIVGPNGVELPITQTVGGQMRVTVPDRGTIQLGGFQRQFSSINTIGPALPGYIAEKMSSHPQMLVTPTILRARTRLRR